MSVVVEIPEPKAAAPCIFHYQVRALNAPVGQAREMPAQQLRFPPRDRRCQSGELGDLRISDVLVEHDEASAGV